MPTLKPCRNFMYIGGFSITKFMYIDNNIMVDETLNFVNVVITATLTMASSL